MVKQASRNIVGIEVNSQCIIGCEICPDIGKPMLKRLGVQQLKNPCIVDGEVVNQDELVEELRSFAAKFNFDGRGVITSIANTKVMVRDILVPKMTPDEFKNALIYQAHEYIPIAMENSQIDFEITGEVINPDGAMMMNVMLVAAQKDMVTEFAQSFLQAGFRLKVIDLHAFALQRALLEYQEPKIQTEDYIASSTCLIDIGSDITTFVIVIRDRVKFVRFLSKAWDDFVDSISMELGCEVSFAKEHLMQVGLAMITKPKNFNDEADLMNKMIIGNAIRKTIDDFVYELRKIIDYYSVEEESVVISHILISGIGTRVVGLGEYLAKSLGTDVKSGDPFKNLNTSKVDVNGFDIVKDAPTFAVSVGLGLRGMEA